MLQHQLVRSTVLGQSLKATELTVAQKTNEEEARTRSNLNFLNRCGKIYPWGSFRLERKIQFMNLFTLLMVDWDPAAEGEDTDGHYTIRSKQEVFTILEERVANHPDELWRVYKTPSGGIHTFLLSHKVTPVEGYEILTEMRGDTLYRDMSVKRNKWGVRVSPKPGREGDFIARYIKTYGKGNPLEEHLGTMQVHDSFLPVN